MKSVKQISIWLALLAMVIAGAYTLYGQQEGKPQQAPPHERPAHNLLTFNFQNVKTVTPPDGFQDPIWSPDSEKLATSKQSLPGIYVVDVLLQLPPEQLTTDGSTAFGALWSDDQIVYERPADDLKTTWQLKSVDVRTRETAVVSNVISDVSLPVETQPGVVTMRDWQHHAIKHVRVGKTQGPTPEGTFAYQEDNQIFIATPDGKTKQISDGNQSYFMPMLSPDGRKVLYASLTDKFYITDIASGKTISIVGSGASWSPNSRHVVFQRTQDDGHDVIASDLYIADLQGNAAQLTNTPDRIELSPKWSPDGKKIAFQADGAIYVGEFHQGNSQ